ncbi:hypothetical protein BTJ40_05320 [Microbulbifer sp. A4B17]|nr:hypothetical protein BTJ40_05320 [Microbulbifer sp. A4B17]
MAAFHVELYSAKKNQRNCIFHAFIDAYRSWEMVSHIRKPNDYQLIHYSFKLNSLNVNSNFRSKGASSLKQLTVSYYD